MFLPTPIVKNTGKFILNSLFSSGLLIAVQKEMWPLFERKSTVAKHSGA